MFPVIVSSPPRSRKHLSPNSSLWSLRKDPILQSEPQSIFKQRLDPHLPIIQQSRLDKVNKYVSNKNKQSLSSESSDSPYKQQDEKQLMMKIMSLHDEVIANPVKKKQQLARRTFVKGLFNDKAQEWEMRHNSTRATNYANISYLKNLKGPQHSRQNYSLEQNSNTKLKVSKSQSQIGDVSQLLSTRSKCLVMSASKKQFNSFQNQRIDIISRCFKVQNGTKLERKELVSKEEDLRQLIQEQKKNKVKMRASKEKLIEAGRFASLVSQRKHKLRQYVYEKALKDYEQEDKYQKMDQKLDKFLLEDILRQRNSESTSNLVRRHVFLKKL